MPLVKCKFCRTRVLPFQVKLHEKRCPYARRAKRREIAALSTLPEGITIEKVNREDILFTPEVVEIKLIDKGKKRKSKVKDETNN